MCDFWHHMNKLTHERHHQRMFTVSVNKIITQKVTLEHATGRFLSNFMKVIHCTGYVISCNGVTYCYWWTPYFQHMWSLECRRYMSSILFLGWVTWCYIIHVFSRLLYKFYDVNARVEYYRNTCWHIILDN